MFANFLYCASLVTMCLQVIMENVYFLKMGHPVNASKLFSHLPVKLSASLFYIYMDIYIFLTKVTFSILLSMPFKVWPTTLSIYIYIIYWCKISFFFLFFDFCFCHIFSVKLILKNHDKEMIMNVLTLVPWPLQIKVWPTVTICKLVIPIIL